MVFFRIEMPRSPRVLFPGAIYHVMSRGNYRQDLFTVHRTGIAFEKALFEACERYHWLLHAYVIMRNHFHLAVETPAPNLTGGMQWLLSTFANRFNRFCGQLGHVFQGRYKALVVERGPSLLRVVDYIHLNPVRAGFVRIENLGEYSLSSLPKFLLGTQSECLVGKDWLKEAGGWDPSVSGMRMYVEYLHSRRESDPVKALALTRQLTRGWFFGTQEGKKSLLEELARGEAIAHEKRMDLFDLIDDEIVWEKHTKLGLEALGKREGDLAEDRRCAEWKVVLGGWLKSQHGLTNRWLSERLQMGDISNLSRQLSRHRSVPTESELQLRRNLDRIPKYQA